MTSADEVSGTYNVYQLNGAAPVTTTKTTFSVKPTRGTDAITVSALSPGGNIGDAATCVINAAAPATAPDGDLTGDGIADLTTVGKQANLPAGLWLAPGQAGSGHTTGNGQILTTAADIGAQGTATDTNGTPADWTGTQAITGHFATGDGFNDILDYNPTTGAGQVLNGSGDGSALSPASGAEVNVWSGVFTDDSTSNTATHVANAGNLYNAGNQDSTTSFPDLLLTINGSLYLEVHQASPGIWEGFSNGPDTADLLDTNPTGSGDWTGWTITTTLVGGLPAMFARSDTGGQLYYYSPTDLTNLAQNYYLGAGNTVTPNEIATSGWTTSTAPLIQAADINTDGTPDLWSVTGAGTATAHTSDGTTLTALTAQALTADSHTWALNDGPAATATDTTVATATDSSGTTALPLTGGGSGAQWDSGDLFDPDVTLSGTSTGVMTTTTHALTTSANFSVSLWAKPLATGGVVLSQDGSHTSGFTIYPNTSTDDWYFCLATADTTTQTPDCAHGGTVHLGTWTHLTATYNPTTTRAALYEDGIEVSQTTHTAVTGFTGQLNIGQQLSAGSHTSYYKGSVANIQTWAGTTLTPTQAAALSGTPGYVLFPSDSTNYTNGSTWKLDSGKATMTFTAGLLTITETGACTSSCTWTEGTTGHSSGILTLQSDGNLVIYAQTAHTTGTALWSSATSSHPNDTLFLQPDGNLVIYDADGTVLWSSHTYN